MQFGGHRKIQTPSGLEIGDNSTSDKSGNRRVQEFRRDPSWDEDMEAQMQSGWRGSEIELETMAIRDTSDTEAWSDGEKENGKRTNQTSEVRIQIKKPPPVPLK
jgi:hypothetical protein